MSTQAVTANQAAASNSQVPAAAENPMKDTNGNGILDGAEIIAQLAAEDENGAERTPNERAHGVLYMSGIKGVLLSWNRDVAQNPVLTESDIDAGKVRAALEMTRRLNDQSGVFSYGLNKDPNFADALKVQISELKKMSPQEKAIMHADVESMVAFANNFSKDFPSGIDIKPQDVAPILSRLGTLNMPQPEASPQQQYPKLLPGQRII